MVSPTVRAGRGWQAQPASPWPFGRVPLPCVGLSYRDGDPPPPDWVALSGGITPSCKGQAPVGGGRCLWVHTRSVVPGGGPVCGDTLRRACCGDGGEWSVSVAADEGARGRVRGRGVRRGRHRAAPTDGRSQARLPSIGVETGNACVWNTGILLWLTYVEGGNPRMRSRRDGRLQRRTRAVSLGLSNISARFTLPLALGNLTRARLFVWIPPGR